MCDRCEALEAENAQLRRILRQAELALYGTTYHRHIKLMIEIADAVPLEGAADELEPGITT